MAAEHWPRSLTGGTMPRSALVRDACRTWIARLDDLAGRSSLVRWQDAGDGALELGEIDRDALRELLHGRPVAFADLLRPRGEPEARILRVLRDRALESREEYGTHTLHLGLGLATWRRDGQEPPLAPALLLPVDIASPTPRGLLRRRGRLAWNPMLLELLEREHGRAFALLGDAADLAPDGNLPEDPWAPLRAAAGEVPEFELREESVLGHFFPHHAHLLRDLRRQASRLGGHDVVAALAGDPQARRTLASGSAAGETSPRRIVLPADETQLRAVDAVRRGESCILEGAPGSGKSQTVANIAAAMVGGGQRVLVVAQKPQALRDVQRRLAERGLGDLVLDLALAEHEDGEVRRRIVAAARDAAPPDGDFYDEETLRLRRKNIEDRIAALHRMRSPSDVSIFDMQTRLLRAPKEISEAGLVPRPELARMDAATVRHVKLLLADASDLGDLLAGRSASPWASARLPDPEAATDAVGQSLEAHRLWQRFTASLERLREFVPAVRPQTFADAEGLARLLAGVNASYRRYGAEVWTAEVAVLGQEAPRGPLATWHRERRAAVRRLRELRRDPRVSVATLREDVRAMLRQAAAWKSLSGQDSPPPELPEADRLLELVEALRAPLLKLSSMLGPRLLAGRSLESLGDLIAGLARDQVTPHRLPVALTIGEELERHGALDIARDLIGRKIDPAIWPQAFEFLWLEACLDQAKSEEPELSGLYGRDLDRLRQSLLDLELDELRAAAKAVRLAQRRRAALAVAEHPEQARLLREEAARADMPLTGLLAAAPDVLLALFPCWLASPWAVSEVVDGEHRPFDVVLCDEAGQLPLEPTLGAISRGSRLVLAGDRRQLPPPGTAAPMRSLMEACAFLPSYRLGWHYRSRDEALFAFANRRVYDGAVRTFPGRLGHGEGLRHVLLAAPGGAQSQDAPMQDLAPLLDLILRQAEAHPDESLGVVALTPAQARRIEAALRERLHARPELEPFFSQDRPERFFVKPVDLVQGDERDGVILAIGIDDPAREFALLWGPTGLGRLNVATTRARRRMTVASRLRRQDVPEIGPGSGVALLREFLQFAEMRHEGAMAAALTDEPVNPLEEELEFFPEQVYFALRDHGLDVVPQYGAMRHLVDLAVRHPERPQEYILAIACDAQERHPAPTRRDYDRQRQLERLGWRLHRMWAGDWAADRDGEIARVLEAWRAAARQVADRV